MKNQKSSLKQHRKANRLKNYDYSQDGYYFITICIQNKKEYFGAIENGEMILNEYGQIAEKRWLWLAEQYAYIKLDQFVIMPNHVHGILIIDNAIPRSRDNPRIVPTGGAGIGNMEIYQRRHNLLSKTINAYKTTSSILIHKTDLKHFKWQRSFYDHIIRNEKSLHNIRRYIQNNPLKWELEKDRDHISNLSI